MKSLTINIGHHETDPMKERILEGFGKRLVSIRKSSGITQTELGSRVGVSKRVIAYYEDENAQPPGAMLVDLAHALSVSTDELLGLKPARTLDPNTARVSSAFERSKPCRNPPIAVLVFKFIYALLQSHIDSSPARCLLQADFRCSHSSKSQPENSSLCRSLIFSLRDRKNFTESSPMLIQYTEIPNEAPDADRAASHHGSRYDRAPTWRAPR